MCIFIYIGNISNPIVTRLGINQYWYRHWYSDKIANQSTNIHTDNLIAKLLHIYLNYGLFFKKNIILNSYWFSFKKTLKTQYINIRHKKLFRHYHYKNTNVNFEHAYSIRINSGEYFPMKTIYLRYRYWYIICMHWFKPIKKKTNINKIRKAMKIKRRGTLTMFDLTKQKPITRVKLLFYFFLKNLKNFENKYSF